MHAPKLTLRVPLELSIAIETRVAAMTPQHQASAQAEILAMLRDEYGEALEIRGESAVRRAVQMVRAWKMS